VPSAQTIAQSEVAGAPGSPLRAGQAQRSLGTGWSLRHLWSLRAGGAGRAGLVPVERVSVDLQIATELSMTRSVPPDLA